MFGHEERVVYEPLTPGAIEVGNIYSLILIEWTFQTFIVSKCEIIKQQNSEFSQLDVN